MVVSNDATNPPNLDVGTAWTEVVDHPGILDWTGEWTITNIEAQYVGLYYPQQLDWVNLAEFEVCKYCFVFHSIYCPFVGSI